MAESHGQGELVATTGMQGRVAEHSRACTPWRASSSPAGASTPSWQRYLRQQQGPPERALLCVRQKGAAPPPLETRPRRPISCTVPFSGHFRFARLALDLVEC